MGKITLDQILQAKKREIRRQLVHSEKGKIDISMVPYKDPGSVENPDPELQIFDINPYEGIDAGISERAGFNINYDFPEEVLSVSGFELIRGLRIKAK